LISDFSGVVRDGEMLLVLGTPGSGCSTFLKAISNQRESFAGVKGDVSYGGISADEQKKKYRGEVNYNEEDDQHLPTLTVGQTLEFSLLNKTRKHEKGDIPIIITALMKMFGIGHCRNTLVGDVSSFHVPSMFCRDLIRILETCVRLSFDLLRRSDPWRTVILISRGFYECLNYSD
jgi:ABC-type multidrug transport system ATPase subunit